MRTSEKFQKIWDDMVWYVAFHNSPVWLVPMEDYYALSVIKPDPKELPFGTVANLYDQSLNIVDSIYSSRNPW